MIGKFKKLEEALRVQQPKVLPYKQNQTYSELFLKVYALHKYITGLYIQSHVINVFNTVSKFVHGQRLQNVQENEPNSGFRRPRSRGLTSIEFVSPAISLVEMIEETQSGEGGEGRIGRKAESGNGEFSSLTKGSTI